MGNKPAVKTESGASAASANGKKIYTQYCLSCHMADGGGVQNMNPSLIRSSYVLGDDGRIIKIVLQGFNDNVAIDGQTYTNKMPSFKNLKDKDIADVLTYVRNHFTNNAGAVSVKDVTTVRGSIK